jgi:hypothetical protein
MRRTLITLVIVMGVLIIVGSVVLVVGLVNQLGTAGDAARAARVEVAKAPVLRLGLPKGTQVRRMVAAGDRLMVHVTLPDGGDWIYVVPLSGGRALRIAVTGGAPATTGKSPK